MTIDKPTIINMTLADIGVGPVFSVDDGSELSENVALVWQRTVDQIFGLHDWSFALKTFKNRLREEEPENGWRYAFDLPGVRIGNPLKNMEQAGASPRPLRQFTIEEGLLYANCRETWSLCKFLVSPDIWPPDFRSAFVVAFGGYLAVPIWQDENLRADRLQEAFGSPSQQGGGGLFGRLMAQDKTSRPVGEPMEGDSPLINVRPQGAGDGGDTWHGRW
ncbi:hypothetical protein RvVAT039_02160 [Agrobacterium vitis]|uniref:hypothetical protein n=1 Tax=Rhizobium/Agrobacterium group TaxID=227290 RepID=UPI0015D94F87|nr:MULTISPECIES: hypothetical protein [Rhizobium/Agrobacterium group]MCF1471196.1 hypothetical protein [Allorhizobium ampelinum]BCH59196.1 hypothetical protein RvVAR0630_18200 [Agrobacterium vitis]BCH63000.1 hypothetical protein RvVAT039_02160 [Agrobacterium vitis]